MWVAMPQRVIKGIYVCVGAYFQHRYIVYHPANIVRVRLIMEVGYQLANFT